MPTHYLMATLTTTGDERREPVDGLDLAATNWEQITFAIHTLKVKKEQVKGRCFA